MTISEPELPIIVGYLPTMSAGALILLVVLPAVIVDKASA